MAYDEGLAMRLQDILGDEAGLAEKKMFGGLAILLDGHMAAGVYGDDLLVRTDPGQQDTLLAEPGTRPFDTIAQARRRDSSGPCRPGAGTVSDSDADRVLAVPRTLPFGGPSGAVERQGLRGMD